jgi:hypothetical protein
MKKHSFLSRVRLVHTLRVGWPVLFFLLLAVQHRVYAYTYSDGSVLCPEHVTDTSDPDNESGQAYEVYSWEELHADLVCDADGQVLLPQNCLDGCGSDQGVQQ